ncbi:MAG: hypothetical protein IPL26_16790 [Leptospiraceae bacterium]|nr:hypothetical protein [Leptospiraceae bacterium]
MKENNLFSFPKNANSVKFLSKKQRLRSLSLNFENMDKVFVEKSAQDFAKSILSEELYQELRPKKEKEKGNLTHI